MTINKALAAFLLPLAVSALACKYIVVPEGLETSETGATGTWSGAVTGVSQTADGALRIDLYIHNQTGDWSAMQALPDRAAELQVGAASTMCDTVFVSTGGHRLAPGFRMRGYVGGTKAEPLVQPLYVECAGAEAAPGATLTISYSFVTGQYNYYEQDATLAEESLALELDAIETQVTYPLADQPEDLIQTAETEITALNDAALQLADVQRGPDGLQFTWRTTNPGEYPTYVHIGNPPVIGEDGILYGFYETPDIVSVPITPAGESAEWTTQVAIPSDLGGLYILLSAESGKARLFANYAIDITDK
jgi:hypothetical protein